MYKTMVLFIDDVVINIWQLRVNFSEPQFSVPSKITFSSSSSNGGWSLFPAKCASLCHGNIPTHSIQLIKADNYKGKNRILKNRSIEYEYILLVVWSGSTSRPICSEPSFFLFLSFKQAI